MKLITLNVTKKQLEGLDELIRYGFYPNRAEAIRFAIRDLLESERHLELPIENLENEDS